MAALKTVPNVEILATGEWDAATGPFICTKEDILAALAAWDDPAVRSPIVKLGHKSPLGDGEPALGRWVNPRLNEDGTVLVADAVGVPEWLADCMASAYPRRSIEGMRGVVTATGHKHRLMLTAVSLLGAEYPAVTTLDDIQMLFAATSFDEIKENFEMVAASAATDNPVLEEGPDMGLFNKGGKDAVAASVAADDVRRMWYDSLDQRDRYWMWVKEIQVQPQQLIVLDEETEQLFRVGYSIDSGEEVTFADPFPVTIVYQDEEVAAAQGIERITYTKEESITAKDRSNDPLPTEVQPMTEEQLAKIGLPKDATQEQIDAKLAELAELAATAATASDTPPAGDDEGEGEGGETPAPTPPGSAPVTVPQAKDGETFKAPEGTVLVDAAQRETELSQLRQLWADREKAAARQRDELVAASIADGKFPPSMKDHYRKLLDKDPEGTTALLSALQPGVVTVELGHGGTGEDKKSEDEYPAEWAGAFMGGKA